MRTAEELEVGAQEENLAGLYEAHALRAFRFAYVLTGSRDVAEDLLQEAFIRTFKRLATLRDRDAFPGYLRTTILNLARAQMRRRRFERLALRREAVLGPAQLAEQPDIEQRDRLWQALQDLPYRQRAALVLRYYEDLSERETAGALGTSVAGVKALVSRGIKTVRVEFGRREEVDEP